MCSMIKTMSPTLEMGLLKTNQLLLTKTCSNCLPRLVLNDIKYVLHKYFIVQHDAQIRKTLHILEVLCVSGMEHLSGWHHYHKFIILYWLS